MKLDRNGPDGRGKYAVVKLRKMPAAQDDALSHKGPVRGADYVGAKEAVATAALDLLIAGGFVTIGTAGDDDEFFVVMLKDKYAPAALYAYAAAAINDGEHEYGRDVQQLGDRSGLNHPACKKPD
jgi:hypothetical protein